MLNTSTTVGRSPCPSVTYSQVTKMLTRGVFIGFQPWKSAIYAAGLNQQCSYAMISLQIKPPKDFAPMKVETGSVLNKLLGLILWFGLLSACATTDIEEHGSEIAGGSKVTATVMASATPEATPSLTPFFVVDAPMPDPLAWAQLTNPPEYLADSGEIYDGTDALSGTAYFISLYEMYKLKYGAVYFDTQEDFEQKMWVFAQEEGLQVFQSESPDEMQIVSFPVKNNGDGTWSMWWFATEGGAFSARPDIPSTAGSTWTEIQVDGQIGGSWGEDGNFYVFQLNQNGEAVTWFSPAESVVGDVMWREVVKQETAIEQPVASAELLELAAMYPLVEDWRQAERCQIPWELVKEGIPGKIAKLEGQPFPETAYNTGDIYLHGSGSEYTHLTWGWGHKPEDVDYRTNPETRPYRWVGYFSTVDGDGNEYIGAVQQWLNPSGKISYLTYIKLSGESDIYWMQMAVGWPIVDIGTTIDNDELCIGYEELCEIDYDPEKNKLLHQWQETREIPDQLESKVLLPFVNTKSVYMPLP